MCKYYVLICILLLESLISGCTVSSPFSGRELNFYGYNLNHQTISRQGENIWHLDSFPLRILIDSDIEQLKKNQIISALEQWNSIIGFYVFRWEEIDLEETIHYGQFSEPERNVVYVFESELGRDTDDNHILGLATNYIEYGQSIYIRSSLVLFDEELLATDMYYVCMHEFGHVLGLKHDRDDISSIMYPHVLSSFGNIKPEDLVYIRNQLYR